MNLEEEKKLVEEAKKNSQAFSILYEEYYSRIFGYILKRVSDVELAQDITSETFVKALEKIWSFKWKGISFSSWIYRIASNETVNFYRKKKIIVSLEKISEPKSVSNPLEEIIRAQEEIEKNKEFLSLHKKISQLPVKYQEVIYLRFFEKKKIEEIAEILGKKEGTIKTHLHRGLERLRKLF